ncbi:hypothetical protein NDU88_009354 [Pleurodeles waltl]|uniref:Uncharacterized protein n=1 Tax=Pleurodeles waltl TaxID=8319 RepID=A0AAV7QUC3_PLEWA|nr:hypothetical protein NDU88_009354 [Pleurodeles waltl]
MGGQVGTQYSCRAGRRVGGQARGEQKGKAQKRYKQNHNSRYSDELWKDVPIQCFIQDNSQSIYQNDSTIHSIETTSSPGESQTLLFETSGSVVQSQSAVIGLATGIPISVIVIVGVVVVIFNVHKRRSSKQETQQTEEKPSCHDLHFDYYEYPETPDRIDDKSNQMPDIYETLEDDRNDSACHKGTGVSTDGGLYETEFPPQELSTVTDSTYEICMPTYAVNTGNAGAQALQRAHYTGFSLRKHK